jgi:ribosomal protein S18 acetylase RimI-like enzyme
MDLWFYFAQSFPNLAWTRMTQLIEGNLITNVPVPAPVDIPTLEPASRRTPQVIYLEPKPAHIAALGCICFEAFGHLHDFHRVPRDFPQRVEAEKAISLFTLRPEFFGVAAEVEGRMAGANFLSTMDKVGGIGPITVAPDFQGCGIGRGLMERVLEHAHHKRMRELRLVQEAINTTSLSLYSSLNFVVREPLGKMIIKPSAISDSSIRLAHAGDLSKLGELGERLYGVNRSRELALWLSMDFKVLVHEKRGQIRGYFMPGKLGHGAANTVEDMLAMIGEAGRLVPAESASFLCPLRNSELLHNALLSGHRLQKVLNYMTRGKYLPPEGVWTPSYGY